MIRISTVKLFTKIRLRQTVERMAKSLESTSFVKYTNFKNFRRVKQATVSAQKSTLLKI